MTSVIQNLKEIVAGLNCDKLVEVYPIWKGRAIVLLTNFSTDFARLSVYTWQGMSNPYFFVPTANALFYALFSSNAVYFIQNHSNGADATDQTVIRQEGLNQIKAIVVLGTLTALFNAKLSRFSQRQLNSEILFAVTAIVLAIHLLFKAFLTSLSLMRSSSLVRPTWITQPRLPRSLYVGLLAHTPFTEENFQALIRSINIQETVLFERFSAFIDQITVNNIPNTPEQREQLIQSIVDEFEEKTKGRLIYARAAQTVFEVVLANHQLKLLRSQSSASSSNSNSHVRAIGTAQADLSQDETYLELIRLGFDARQLSTLINFIAQGGLDILNSLLSRIRGSNALPVLGTNQAFFLEMITSIIKLANPLTCRLLALVNAEIKATVERLLAAGERINEPAYARLLILGFKHDKIRDFDAESIQAFDEFFQQQLTFIEPYWIRNALNLDSFLQDIVRISAVDAEGHDVLPENRLASLKDYLLLYQSIIRFWCFGFKASDFVCLGLDKLGFTQRESTALIDQCLLPHYGKRKVLPQSTEEKEEFFKYISTQFHRRRPQEQQLSRDEIVNLLQPIVDDAIARPEVYRTHELYPGEPGYDLQ